jgi:GNAT superfamily N-acetyltransferase
VTTADRSSPSSERQRQPRVGLASMGGLSRSVGCLPLLKLASRPRSAAADDLPRREGRTGLEVGGSYDALVLIREATDEDWPKIFPFFAAIVGEGSTYAYPEELSSAEARSLWMAEPPGRTVVLVGDDAVLGSATMGPNRPGRGSHIATASFMVDPDHHGRGAGRMLGLHVVEWARVAGYRGIQFNAVVETNHAAVRLWKDLGFEILATVPGAFHHPHLGYVGLHVMFRSLADD